MQYSSFTTKDKGQLTKVESHIGAAKQWTQKFDYDSLGRLSESKEYRGDTNALSYKQKFDYDKFGNLYRKNSSNPTSGQETPIGFVPIEETDINKQTNRFATQTTYDDAGNVIVDSKFRTSNFAYDANGRMVKATRANVPDATSVYDASGMRVAEKVNDVWRFLIYDIGGKLIAEYGGLQSTDEGGVKYLCADWQGSTRAIISQGGYVQARMDYTAFGEDVSAGTGIRTTAQGFNASNNLRQKYGLTERDEATGLDHTWFRKNEQKAGRWTSPDPYNGSMSLSNPQSFNRYSYVENQPTNFVDPSGLLAQGDVCYLTLEDGTRIEGRVDRWLGCNPYGGNLGSVDVFWRSGYFGGWWSVSNNIIQIQSDRFIGSRNGPIISPKIESPKPCFQVGISYSAAAGVGLGGGFAGDVGVTAAHDFGGGSQQTYIAPSGGVFANNGTGVGYPSGNGMMIGAFATAGPSVFISNAPNPEAQAGVFNTRLLATPMVTIQWDRSPDPNSTIQNISVGGPSAGLEYASFQTNTGMPKAANTPFRGWKCN